MLFRSLNQLACGQGFHLLETTEGEVRELLPGYPCLFLRAIPLAMGGGGPLISPQCPHCKSYEGLLGSPTWAELELLLQYQGTQLPANPSTLALQERKAVGEGEAGMIWENVNDTCILYVKQIASPSSMHDTGCSGLVHWDDPEG